MKMTLSLILFAVVLSSCCTGCTFFRKSRDRKHQQLEEKNNQINNESKVMVTGALDSLGFAPTNPPTDLAKKLLKRSQELTGLPDAKDRLDIQAILATNTAAIRDLEKRLKAQEQLIADRDELQRKIRELEGKLIDMGTKYEAERNKTVVRRFWQWSVGTFGVAGAIAFIVFCPAIALPILGRLLGFIVSAIPTVAGFIGVVSNKVLDTTVKGINNYKQSLEKKGLTEAKEMLKVELDRSQDTPHKNVILARRTVLTLNKAKHEPV